jgi:hypothetical protein
LIGRILQIALVSGTPGRISNNFATQTFHEKAGVTQVGFSSSFLWFLQFERSRLCRHPSIHTLLSSDFSLGASCVSSFQQVLLPDNRP